MLCFSPSSPWTDNESIGNSAILHSMTSTRLTSTSKLAHILNLRSFDRSPCVEFKFGFLMDDVKYVRNTSTFFETFSLCPDPVIYPFNNNGKRIQYRYDYLTIEGSNLLDVATKNDYLITIGSHPCHITSISDQQIVCQPTNYTIEKLIRKKRSLLNVNTMMDNQQAIVRVSIVEVES